MLRNFLVAILILIPVLSVANVQSTDNDTIFSIVGRKYLTIVVLGGENSYFQLDPSLGITTIYPFYSYRHFDFNVDMIYRISGRYVCPYVRKKNFEKYSSALIEEDVPMTKINIRTQYKNRLGISMIMNVSPTIYFNNFVFLGFGPLVTLSYEHRYDQVDTVVNSSGEVFNGPLSEIYDLSGTVSLLGFFRFGIIYKNFNIAFLIESEKDYFEKFLFGTSVSFWLKGARSMRQWQKIAQKAN